MQNEHNYQKPINYQSEQWKSFARKNGKRLFFYGLLLILLLILLNECFYIVGEAEQAVVSRFGVIKQIVVNSRNDFHEKFADELKDEITLSKDVKIVVGGGLQWKMPFVDRVERYSSRLYTYRSDSEKVNTSEKKQYYFSTLGQWYIADPALFSLKLGSMNTAENQLDNLIHPVIVQAINKLTAEDFVSKKEVLNATLAECLIAINKEMCLRGIEVKDIQIHRTTLPPANIESTYARMQADRAKVAQDLRSTGQEKYLMDVADTDLEARGTEAEAVIEAGATRGKGDAEALEIYAKAYGKDEEFFSYWRSLQALEASINQNSTLVLDQNHPLWKDLLAWATQK